MGADAGPTVSLVIVNAGRRAELARVLLSLRYLRYRNFEVIVVSDIDARARPECALPVRWIQFAEHNISAARNLGIAAACGEIVAFCDDDAVPEFGWLDALAAPFAEPAVAAAGGFTRGRNGVSFQWRAVEIDRFGRDRRLKNGPSPKIYPPRAGHFVKTVGTNCAFRRAALVNVGGFDEAYRFFLDETDLNLRLSLAGWSTAVVPQAEVHHGFAASALRTSTRVPKSLFEIGASMAYFLTRHAPGSPQERLEEFAKEQSDRLDRHLLQGQLSATGMRALMAELRAGFDEGANRRPQMRKNLPMPDGTFDPAPSMGSGARRLFASGLGAGRGGAQAARRAAADGDEVTLVHIEPSHRPLTVSFTEDGLFRHRMGIFGRSLRSERRRFASTSARREAEALRVMSHRGPFLP